MKDVDFFFTSNDQLDTVCPCPLCKKESKAPIVEFYFVIKKGVARTSKYRKRKLIKRNCNKFPVGFNCLPFQIC